MVSLVEVMDTHPRLGPLAHKVQVVVAASGPVLLALACGTLCWTAVFVLVFPTHHEFGRVDTTLLRLLDAATGSGDFGGTTLEVRGRVLTCSARGSVTRVACTHTTQEFHGSVSKMVIAMVLMASYVLFAYTLALRFLVQCRVCGCCIQTQPFC